jgi:vacuolar protein-sorting-associated protein 4
LYISYISISYSGSDIATTVRDALMQPVRRIQMATHFRWVEAPSRLDDSKMDRYLTPCSPGAPGAQELNWTDVASDQLLEPDLTIDDFLKAVKATRPTVNGDDLKKQIEFTNDFGQEG